MSKKKISFIIYYLLFVIYFLTSSLLFAQSAAAGDVVYVTATGARYHLDGCSSLSLTRISVTIQDAVLSGYTPCGICRPPAFTVPAGEAQRAASQNTLYRVNTEGLRNTSSANLNRMTRAEVVGHVDGDTVRVRIPNPPAGLNIVETIRLLGVDTPETVHPERQVEFFGREASEYTRTQLYGRNVFLAFDWDLRDRYGRLLAYIYLEDGRCFNAMLVREGYGHAYLVYPFQFMDEFRNLEQEARRERRGLWN